MRQSNGFVLITVLFISIIVGLLVLGTSFTALVDRRVASSQRVGTEAYYVAQAGLERLKTGLFFTLAADYRRADVNACTPDIGVELDLGGGVVLAEGDTLDVTLTGGGTAFLTYQRDRNLFILTSVGVVGNARSTVEVVATAGVGPAGVWDNAIFAERFSGSANRLVAGNAAVYGSMHIVEGAAELDDDAVDFGGGAGVFNNYFGVREASDLMDVAVGSLGERARDVVDLCSLVKISLGQLNVSNNASLGNTDVIENGVVYTGAVEGVYLDDQSELLIQNNTYDDQTGSTNVHLRSGVQSYTGLEVGFPGANAPSNPLVVDGNSDCLWLLYNGAVHLPPRMSQNALLDTMAECSTTNVGADGVSQTASISWDPDTQVLTVEGDVVINGSDVEIGAISNQPLTYAGLGTLRAGENRTVAIRNDVRTSSACSYLQDCAVGIVADGPLNVRTNGVIDLLLFSSDIVQIQQGSAGVTVVGAIVGKDVITANVPKILSHPDVAAIAERIGMPGSEPGNEGYLRDISMARR